MVQLINDIRSINKDTWILNYTNLAAIAAIAPIVKAKDEDAAIGVGIIALMGTIFSIGYTLIVSILPIFPLDYGIWSGTSLHELAHVAIAADPAGKDALAIGLLSKLGRVFLLVPLAFIFIYIIKRKSKSTSTEQNKIAFPWFLIGFILMSLLGSYVLRHLIPINKNVMSSISNITT